MDKTPRAIELQSSQTMRKPLQERIVPLRAKVDANIRKSQSRYKLDCDRHVRKVPSFDTGSYVFLTNPLLRKQPGTSEQTMVQHTNDKLQTRASGPYRIISAQRNGITIDDNCDPYNYLIAPVALAPLHYTHQPSRIIMRIQLYWRLAIRRMKKTPRAWTSMLSRR